MTGNLKLKKEGEGTFSAAKAGQAYSGGTDVDAGTVLVGSSGNGHFGSGIVHIPTGTTYDAYGNADSSVNLVLAGGKIANNGVNATLPSTLRMTEDSTIEFAVLPANHDMTIPAGAVWNLGGKTLSVVMDGYDPDLQVRDVTISNGTFTVTVNTYNNETKGYVQIYKLRGGDGLNLDLGNTCLRLSSGGVATSQVCDFTANLAYRLKLSVILAVYPNAVKGIFRQSRLRCSFSRLNPKTEISIIFPFFYRGCRSLETKGTANQLQSAAAVTNQRKGPRS